MTEPQNSLNIAESLFRQHGGMLRTTEAIALGIHPRTLYQLRDAQRLVAVSHGLYRLERVRKLKAERDDGTSQAKKGVATFFALFPIRDQPPEPI